jgi:hypothetical protein
MFPAEGTGLTFESCQDGRFKVQILIPIAENSKARLEFLSLLCGSNLFLKVVF